MDNQHYIAALKKRLHRLDRQSRKDILREIESAAADNPQISLESRFGSVGQLAQQYLHGIPEASSGWSVLARMSKWALIAVGALTLSVILVLIWLYYAFSRDDFDYSDKHAPELRSLHWVNTDAAPKTLYLYQTETIVYPDEGSSLRYACAGEHGLEWHNNANGSSAATTAAALRIQRNQCFLKIPAATTHIEAEQSTLVLVGSNHDMALQLKQAKLRIAPEQPLALQLNLKECDVEEGLTSTPDAAVTLQISGEQCQVSPYHYD